MQNIKQKKSKSEIRNMKIRNEINRRRSEGQKPKEMYFEVAIMFGLSEGRIKKIYYKIKAR